MGQRVHQEDETKLKATVTQAEKDRTVTQVAKDRTVTNVVKVFPDDPETWNIYVRGKVLVEQDTAAELKATVDVAANQSIEATQGTAANLKTEVTPSGDMARKEFYDRNASVKSGDTFWDGDAGAHSSTTRATYTVPDDRYAFMSLSFLRFGGAIATAGKNCQLWFYVDPTVGNNTTVVFFAHESTTATLLFQTLTAHVWLLTGDALILRSNSDDTINHYFQGSACIVEFDA